MNRRSKDDVLADVGSLVQDGTLTFDELQRVYNFNAPERQQVQPAAPADTATVPPAEGRAKTISNVLYIVGTLIVCLGIVLLISQNWSQMHTVLRIMATVGLGAAVFAGGLYRARRQTLQVVNTDLLTGSLFTIACVALSVGAGVVVTELGGDLSEPGMGAAVCLVTSSVFLALYMGLVRSAVILLAAIAVAVFGYFAGVEWATQDVNKSILFYCLETAFAGVLLVCGGILFRPRAVAARLCDLLYGVGTLLSLAAFFWLTITGDGGNFFGGETKTLVYDILYPAVLAGGIALSVLLRSRGILVLTAIFMTGYIFEISAEYFSDFLGGSVALCLAGGLVIGMAYGATRFAKRYIAPR